MLTAGSTPLTKTVIEARADANWWHALVTASTTVDTIPATLNSFC